MYSVVKEYFGEKHVVDMETERRKLTGHYDELKQRIDTLKSRLEQVYPWEISASTFIGQINEF